MWCDMRGAVTMWSAMRWSMWKVDDDAVAILGLSWPMVANPATVEGLTTSWGQCSGGLDPGPPSGITKIPSRLWGTGTNHVMSDKWYDETEYDKTDTVSTYLASTCWYVTSAFVIICFYVNILDIFIYTRYQCVCWWLRWFGVYTYSICLGVSQI